MKHNIKFLSILATSMSFRRGLFSQIQIGGRIVKTMSIIPFILVLFIFPSYVAAQSTSDTIVRNEAANYFAEFDEPIHRELSSKPALITIPSVNSTDDQEVIKDKVTDLPTIIAPPISKQPMMNFVGDAAFNDWVVYMTLKAKLAEDRNDK